MVEGLYSAAAGMSAEQFQLDAVGNDLANMSTDGYKAQRVAFGDLLYNQVRMAGTETSAGSGASARLLGRSETQGPMQQTGNPLDLAIEGEGFFTVTLPGGGTALTRDGAFGIDGAGSITDARGNRLSPPIKVPAGTQPADISVAADGTVRASGRVLGRFSIVTVPAPDGLEPLGDSLFAATARSGAPAAASGRAHVRQGALEQSNVNLGREIVKLETTQRSFQMASSAIQDESQMMSIANQLRP